MSRDDVFSHYPETLAIGPGVTAQINAIPGQNAITIKYLSGGSMSITGTSLSVGSTYAISNIYPVGTVEVLNINLSGTINITASGSTLVCSLLRYRSAGF